MNTIATPERLLTVPETARELGVSRSWLYGEIAAGRLPAIALGRRKGHGRMLRIDPRDVARLVEDTA